MSIFFAPLDAAGLEEVRRRAAEREASARDRLDSNCSARRGQLRQNSHAALAEDLGTLALVSQVIDSPSEVVVRIDDRRERYAGLRQSELVNGRLHIEGLVHPRIEADWHALEVHAALTARDGRGAPIFADVMQLLRLPTIVRRFFVQRLLAQQTNGTDREPARELAMDHLSC
jgi:hypothetical protein